MIMEAKASHGLGKLEVYCTPGPEAWQPRDDFHWQPMLSILARPESSKGS